MFCLDENSSSQQSVQGINNQSSYVRGTTKTIQRNQQDTLSNVCYKHAVREDECNETQAHNIMFCITYAIQTHFSLEGESNRKHMYSFHVWQPTLISRNVNTQMSDTSSVFNPRLWLVTVFIGTNMVNFLIDLE